MSVAAAPHWTAPLHTCVLLARRMADPWTAAQSIYETFLAPNSVQELNISATMRAQIMAVFNSAAATAGAH